MLKQAVAKFVRRTCQIFFEEKLAFEKRTQTSVKQPARPHKQPPFMGEDHTPAGVDVDSIALLKDIHLGKRCFVIGNGPSLRMEDLDRLRWEYTFASNKIYLAFKETDWRPTYYSVEDSLVMRQHAAEINAIQDTLKLMPSFSYLHLGCDINTFFFRFPIVGDSKAPLKNKDFPQFSSDAGTCVYWGSTIVYTQIQLAVHMGFRDIYVIGVDHSYITPKKLKDKTYYISEGEQNHFSAEYRPKGEKWHKPQLEVLKRSYRRAKEACDARGVRIFNASRSTKLDAFPRINFDDIPGI